MTKLHSARWLAAFSVGCASAPPPQSSPPSQSAPSPSTPAEQAEQQLAPTHGEHHMHHGQQGFHMDFSDVERFAKHFDGPDRDGWQNPEEVVALLDLREGQTVVDLGAGTGYFLPHLSPHVGATGRVLAVDVEPNMVAYMKRRATEQGLANIEARVVAPDDPGLSPASVDRILIVDTWHHIDDRVEYAKKLRAALRPEGLVAVVDFTKESEMGPPPGHRLSAAEVGQELDAAGFHTRTAEETLPNQYVVLGSP